MIYPSSILSKPEHASMKKRKHSSGGDDEHDEMALITRLLAERRAKAEVAVELANKAIDALVDLEAMMESEVSDDEDAYPLFAERGERDFLLDAQRVAIDIRLRAIDYVGPPTC